ncbi:hypothetical protein HYFRA_00011986 [Hymenoscyphus fraxineus]|uniref:Uncharacterized protein n=1 Tax=Hymenoscyphus fraxineus TaxID=746836 RepID=A0A9N9KZI4_9HELO|nr:hypothetical protein HYFRA_00011986 [Hymenoscyphus fraxineus]
MYNPNNLSHSKKDRAPPDRNEDFAVSGSVKRAKLGEQSTSDIAMDDAPVEESPIGGRQLSMETEEKRPWDKIEGRKRWNEEEENKRKEDRRIEDYKAKTEDEIEKDAEKGAYDFGAVPRGNST